MVDALLWGGSAARRGSSSLLLFTTCSYNKGCNAEIAQLVEHNLAKVGVASSSLVFRSKSSSLNTCPGGGIGRRARFRCVCRKACRFESCSGHGFCLRYLFVGEVAELVDALLWGGSDNCVVGVRVSSSSQIKNYFLCGNSSVGRARPCQGRGREFESRLPLFSCPFYF